MPLFQALPYAPEIGLVPVEPHEAVDGLLIVHLIRILIGRLERVDRLHPFVNTYLRLLLLDYCVLFLLVLSGK